MNLIELAQRLKRFRVEKGLTLEEVAARAGLTRGWLSKVENFRVTPSLPALSAIAQALGVTMAELFEGLEDRPALVIVRKNERSVLRRDEEMSGLVYESLAHTRPARQMDPFLVTVPAHDARPALSHSGEEFLTVLSGNVVLEYDDQKHELGAGDTAYFDGNHPHRLVNRTADPATMIIVYHALAGQGDWRPDDAEVASDTPK